LVLIKKKKKNRIQFEINYIQRAHVPPVKSMLVVNIRKGTVNIWQFKVEEIERNELELMSFEEILRNPKKVFLFDTDVVVRILLI
jgi:hypothetical protein